MVLLGYLAVFPTALGFYAWNAAMGRISLNLVTIMQYLTPIMTILMAWALLGETLSLFEIFGAVLVIALAMTGAFRITSTDVEPSSSQTQTINIDAEDTTGDNVDNLDFVDSASRFDILENKVALAVPEGNPKGIEGFDQLAELLSTGDVFMAMGNADVPVGQYTQAILEFYGLDEAALAQAGCITYGSNVKEVTSQVSEATVDCGVIYQTDSFSAGLTVVDEATADMCGQVVYPAAALREAPNPDGAAALLEFLRGEEASACFEEVGFTPLAEA